MRREIIYILMLLFCIHIHGQKRCGSELNLTEIRKTDPARYQRIMDLENQIDSLLSNPGMFRSASESVITIPVVVHIVWNKSAENISDAQVYSQIEVLNEDFRRLNANRTNTPSAFANVARDAKIQFKLASVDPYGRSTTGIKRYPTAATKFYQNDDAVKKHYPGWDPNKYLNIWVCNLYTKDNSGGEEELLGYAQFPSELRSSPGTDGVVINYKYFGRDGSAVSPYNKGRTATHEVGHWLNLRHIWGDDGETGCHCEGSDEVDDTPNQSVASYGCPSFPMTDCCTPSSPGIMFMNYMDYVNDACMNMFTNGQIDRMRAVFESERWQLKKNSEDSNGNNPGGEENPDPEPEPPLIEDETNFNLTVGERHSDLDKPSSLKWKAVFPNSSFNAQKIYWQLRVNKIPGLPYPEYCSQNNEVYCIEKYTDVVNSSSTFELSNDSSLIFNYPAEYTFKLIAKESTDGYEKQASREWTFYLSQYDDRGNIDIRDGECSTVDFEIIDPKPKYLLGDIIKVKSQITFVDDLLQSNWDSKCHFWSYPDPDDTSIVYQIPTHDGLFSISWLVNGRNKIYEEYTSSYQYRNTMPGNYYVDKVWEFQLTETGINTIVLEPIGGCLDRDSENDISIILSNKFFPFKNMNKARKSVLVADCEGKVTINKEYHPLLSKYESIAKTIGKGTIEIENVNLDYSEYEIEAYKKIIFKPGTKVIKGTKLIAKIEDCNLSINNLKDSEQINILDDKNYEDSVFEESENILGKIKIYPNPTDGIVKVEIPVNLEVFRIEIYNLQGARVREITNINQNPQEIDVSNLPNGIYVLRILVEGGLYDQKIIKK